MAVHSLHNSHHVISDTEQEKTYVQRLQSNAPENADAISKWWREEHTQLTQRDRNLQGCPKKGLTL